MNNAEKREQILGRLYTAQKYGSDAHVPEQKRWEIPVYSREQRIAEFTERMTAVRTEVFRAKGNEWVDALHALVTERGQKTLLHAPETELGKALADHWPKESNCELVTWEGDIEAFKEDLFACDAALTSCMGGIAESAALILWPTPEEPRLMSIVPPLHVVVLKADEIHTSFQDAIEALGWAENIPTNALLISGPSKTADIELILQFGVHGPTDLVVYVVD